VLLYNNSLALVCFLNNQSPRLSINWSREITPSINRMVYLAFPLLQADNTLLGAVTASKKTAKMAYPSKNIT
jgi:hypothetical protein